MLSLQLLGTPVIRFADQPILLAAQKAQALLFYLAAEANRAFTRGQLIALLWEESAEKEGRNSLSTTLSRLRQALPVVPLRVDGDLLAWDAAADAVVDIQEIHATALPGASAEHLESVVARYRGPFLDGFGVRESIAFEEWLRIERERWQYRILNILDQLITTYSAQGNMSRALEHARRAVTIDPLQERFHRALMRLLARSGDRAAAVAQFRACRDLLTRELGVEPDPETSALDAQIRAGTLLVPRDPGPSVETRSAPAGRLPTVTITAAAPPTPERVAARLETIRRQSFVGRQAELRVFAEALAGAELPFTVLHLFGPGGAGKTTLLAAFARHADAAGVPVISIDGRATEPTPDGILAALREQLGGELDLARLPSHVVCCFDTYELLTPVESWLRDTLLPQLPSHALVVLAGRNPPSVAWRADPGWQAMSRSMPLGNLSAADAADYLRRRGIPPDQHDAVIQATHGFPLGLSLAAEIILQHPNARFAGLDAPDLVQALLERFIDHVPSLAHRAALEAASQVHVLDEPLLAAMLARAEARELFDWLQGLSFVARGRRGVFLHDLAGDALAAELRWRNPPWHRELHDRARDFYLASFARGGQTTQQQALLDLIYLHDNPLFRSLFTWHDTGGLHADTARADDWNELVAMVRHHEGEASAQIAARWFAEQPAGVTVIRAGDGVPIGFNCIVALRPDAQVTGDPGIAAIQRFLQSRPPLDTQQLIAVDRFWMDRAVHQGVSPAQGLIFIAATRYLLSTPGLAYSFHVFANPDAWRMAMDQVRFQRLPEADFTVGERSYGVFYQDWRAMPPQAWLAALAEHELGD